MRAVYRVLSILGTVRAAQRGPGALGRRVVRQQAHRRFARVLRRVVRP